MPNRTEILHFRATPEEKAAIKERAEAAGKKQFSAFMRDLALYGGMEVEGIPYETPEETRQKALVRKAVKNGEPIDVQVVAGSAAPTQPAVEESEADEAMWRSIRGETYEQFMERRVGELLGDDATLAANDRATETAEREWAQMQGDSPSA